ncbi:MAG: hypothetical protein IJU23_02855 [Proteobacteria bacterium]|nr:hypothetical protein [Pseudomonadota bacterium]
MKKRNTILALLPICCALASGCTTEFDHDAYRSGAIEIKLKDIVSDEIYPTAGDEIDWKYVFLPAPGDIIVYAHWDDAKNIFNVHVGVYDRFGIPIKDELRSVGAEDTEFRVFVPESGLHYIKVSAESGQTIYSIRADFESNFDGFTAPSEPPQYESYLDFDAMLAEATGAGGGSSSGGGGGGGGAGGGGGDAPAAPAGAVALPTAAAGGVALPTAATGGIAAAEEAGPTIVRTNDGGGSVSAAEVRTLNSSSGEVSNEKAAITPICDDLKGRVKKVEAQPLNITALKKGTKIKLNVGSNDGVQPSAVGDIYVNGKILEGGRFRVDQISEKYCFVTTNAPPEDVKRASKFVVKSPD